MSKAPPFELTNRIITDVAEIAELVGRVSSMNHLSVNPALRRSNRIKTVYGSLAIEQNTLTLDQVTAVLDDKRVLAAGRRLVKAPPVWGKHLLRAGAALISLWGLYAFLRRELGTYLLLQTAFVFFDFEEPLPLFFLDCLAVMGLFAAAGYYGQKLLLFLGKAPTKPKPSSN